MFSPTYDQGPADTHKGCRCLPSCSLGDPSQGPLGPPQPRLWLDEPCPSDTVALALVSGPGALEGLGGAVHVKGWLRDRSASKLGAGVGDLAERRGSGHGLAMASGPPPTPAAILCPLPPPSRKLAPAPFSLSGSLQVVVHQPKVIGVVFWVFFLVFRFFLNKVFF